MQSKQLVDCVQDVTIAYRGGTIPENESDFLFANLPHEIHFYSEKFDANRIAADQPEHWLNERWSRKEKFLTEYLFNILKQ